MDYIRSIFFLFGSDKKRISFIHLLKMKWTPFVLVVGALFLVVLSIDCTGMIDFLEMTSFDMRMKLWREKKSAPDEIVLILIDDASIKAMNTLYGRWPWPRSTFGEVIDFLTLSEVKAILVDILFTEKEIARKNGEMADSDQFMVGMMEVSGRVYNCAQLMMDEKDEYNLSLLNRPLDQEFVSRFSIPVAEKRRNNLPEYNNYAIPHKRLYGASKGIGIVSFSPDKDGVYRKAPLVLGYQKHFFPSLGSAFFLHHRHIDSVHANKGELIFKGTSGTTRVPLDVNGEYVANLYGKFEMYSFSGIYLSYMKLLKGEISNIPVSPEELKNKVVFIGSSAQGIEDLKTSAISPKTPGVLLHASIYGNLLQNDFLRFPSYLFHSVVIFICLVLTVFTSFFILPYQIKLLVPPLLIGAWIFISFFVFQFNWVFKVVSPSIAVLVGFIFSISYLNIRDGKERRKIKNALDQYVSPHILSVVLKESKDGFLKAGIGTTENLSILFSDIRDFTSISEKYPADRVVAFLNTYLEYAVDIIFRNDGTLDKFIGDAIVAFWGAPVKEKNHPLRSVKAAVEIRDGLDSLNLKDGIKKLTPVRVGIGIHTGDVILGNIGSMKKLDFTIIGDSVNLASRIESLTRHYGASILISDSTYKEVEKEFLCRPVDYVRVKGRDIPVMLYEVLKEKKDIDSSLEHLCDAASKGFNLYRNKNFLSALNIFEKIIEERRVDVISDIFAERCRYFMNHPPDEDWDGSFIHQKK